MSRRSHLCAEGPQKFSWNLSKFTDAEGRERHKAECLSHPKIIGLGDDEQSALRAGQLQLQIAVEKSEI